jgi:large subunit ribosomal protein L14e
MGFQNFVEIGRVALIIYGPNNGKLCTIIDVVDANKALIDGPTPVTGVTRQMIPFKHLRLTNIKVEIQRQPREKMLKAAWAKADVLAKWKSSAAGQKIANRNLRQNLSDFDRFKVMVLRKQKAKLLKAKMEELA